MHRGNCAKTERGEWLAAVESVTVTGASGSEICEKNLFARFSQDNAYCILPEFRCRRKIASCLIDAYEQTS